MTTFQGMSVQALKSMHPAGLQVKLLNMDDGAPVETASIGKVTMVDDIGTVHVNWETGSSLGLVAGVDHWEIVETNHYDVAIHPHAKPHAHSISDVRLASRLNHPSHSSETTLLLYNHGDQQYKLVLSGCVKVILDCNQTTEVIYLGQDIPESILNSLEGGQMPSNALVQSLTWFEWINVSTELPAFFVGHEISLYADVEINKLVSEIEAGNA